MSKKKAVEQSYTQDDVAKWAEEGYLTDEQKAIIACPDPNAILQGRENPGRAHFTSQEED